MPVSEQQLSIGFVPLTDSAPLIVAKELGFFEQQGLQVELKKQNSWATLRDRLHAGVLDAAQMLAPMPLASSLGLGCKAKRIITPFVLSLNGNAITLSSALAQELMDAKGEPLELPLSARCLATVIERRKRDNLPPLKFADVFPYSCHHYQLLDWLSDGDINRDDVSILTVPPVSMVGFLNDGEIDAFCVGGPWNAKAVRFGIGLTVTTSYDVWKDMPEKVLGVSAEFAERNPEMMAGMCRALDQACRWLDNTPNRFEAARLMTSANYLNAELDVIAPSLISSCLTHHQQAPRYVPNYNQFSSNGRESVNRPSVSKGAWLLNKMRNAGQLKHVDPSLLQVADVYREDLYDAMSTTFVHEQ